MAKRLNNPISDFVLADFFLTNATEATREKVQWVQTFGADFMFAYGRQPLVYSFSGVVFNSKDKQDFLAMIALQNTVEALKSGKGNISLDGPVGDKIEAIDQMLTKFLSR